MIEPGSTLRSVLALSWCILVGASYLLMQLDSTLGIMSGLSAGVTARLQWVYLLFMAACAALLIIDYWRSRTRVSRPGD